MIVPLMTEKEIESEILKEVQELDNTRDRFSKNFRRLVLKSSKFPVTKLYACKTKKKNLFKLVYTVTKRSQHDSPNLGIFCIYERKEGKYMVAYSCLDKKITIFSPHFFLRYRERILKNESLPMLDVIDTYIRNNKALMSFVINRELVEAYRCFEKNYSDEKINLVASTADGFCFSEEHGNVTIVKTIISREMLTKAQKPFLLELEKETTEIKFPWE